MPIFVKAGRNLYWLVSWFTRHHNSFEHISRFLICSHSSLLHCNSAVSQNCSTSNFILSQTSIHLYRGMHNYSRRKTNDRFTRNYSTTEWTDDKMGADKWASCWKTVLPFIKWNLITIWHRRLQPGSTRHTRVTCINRKSNDRLIKRIRCII